MVKLDLGCGVHKKEGFVGVDSIPFEGVDIVTDLCERWPWEDNSVDEVHASHFIEHLKAQERIHFVNELYRVLKPGGTALLVAPHYASSRAYGDPTHEWPPVGEFWFYYLSRKWRLDDGNAPHTDIKYDSQGFSCDFEAGWSYSMHPQMSVRNVEFQQHAANFYREAIQDIVATLTKR